MRQSPEEEDQGKDYKTDCKDYRKDGLPVAPEFLDDAAQTTVFPFVVLEELVFFWPRHARSR